MDSSAWLEYFADGPNAAYFAPAIESTDELLVSTIGVYEVFKWFCKRRTQSQALDALAAMSQGKIIEVDVSVAVSAATLSLELRLPMADSLMLATARAHEALLWTQDSDFKGIDSVRYRPSGR